MRDLWYSVAHCSLNVWERTRLHEVPVLELSSYAQEAQRWLTAWSSETDPCFFASRSAGSLSFMCNEEDTRSEDAKYIVHERKGLLLIY